MQDTDTGFIIKDSSGDVNGIGQSNSRLQRTIKYITLHLVPLLALVVIAMAMLDANPFTGETIAPFDILTRMPGWKNTGITSPVKHHKHSDVLDFKLPSWRFAREKFRNYELPLWNPLVLGGEPLLLLVTRSILTPAFAVYAIIDDEAKGLYAAALVNLLIISVGSYLLLFSLGGNRFAALLGAVVFSYSGFNTSWFLWHHINTSIWIPWVLYYAVQIIQSKDVRYIPRISLASTMMILGGFPTVAVYGYMALVLLLLSWVIFSRSSFSDVLKGSGLVILGLFLSLLLSAIVIYCLDESLGRLDLGYRRGGSAFRSAKDLLLFVLPFHDGPLTLGRTGYVGILPLMLFFPALWLAWKRGIDWRYVWGISLIIIIAPLAFAWIPMDYIRQIPLIGTSMISRLILLIGLGFSVLSTLVLVAAYNKGIHRAPRLTYLIMFILLLIQVADQRQVFQVLVGHVKAETIYPKTSTIDYVRGHTEPLQGVISDRGYLFPGLLSAYGLSEWFAHGFRTQSEKDLLNSIVEKPFLTSTAAGFSCNQIRFDDANALAYLGKKFVLCSNIPVDSGQSKPHIIFDTTQKNAGSMSEVDLAQHNVQQFVELKGEVSFDGLLIPLTTAEYSTLPEIMLKLSNNNITISQSTVCTILDNDQQRVLDCPFASTVKLTAGRYMLSLIKRGEIANTRLMAVVQAINSPKLKIRIDDAELDGVLGMRGYEIKRKNSFSRVLEGLIDAYITHEPEPGMVLIENSLVSGSAYYLSTLEGKPDAEYDQIRLVDYNEIAMKFEYTGNRSGWVVIPVRSYPGWSVRVNGKQIKPTLFKGVMPAIQVDGKSMIEFDYYPTQYAFPALVSLIGLLLLIVMIFNAQTLNLKKIS
jgi:hypothetical protein